MEICLKRQEVQRSSRFQAQYNQLPNDTTKDLVLFISPSAVVRLCTKLIYLVGDARGLPGLDVSLTSCSEREKESERERKREKWERNLGI